MRLIQRIRSEISDAWYYFNTGKKTWSPYHDDCAHRFHFVWRDHLNNPYHHY